VWLPVTCLPSASVTSTAPGPPDRRTTPCPSIRLIPSAQQGCDHGGQFRIVAAKDLCPSTTVTLQPRRRCACAISIADRAAADDDQMMRGRSRRSKMVSLVR
jgi:hypothetical protein